METENKEKSDTQLVEESVGWAIYYEKEDAWLTTGHGYHIEDYPCVALILKTKEQAEETLKDAKDDWEHFGTGKVVKAWIPVIANFQYEVKSLKKANIITPNAIRDIIYKLEDVICDLEGDKK